MRVVVGLAALLVVVGAARAAHASERAFVVTWQAPGECPDAPALVHYVDQVAGEAGSGPVTVRAAGTVTRNGDGRYAATLELDTGAARPSTRALDAADCESVSRAAALLIALAIRAQATPTVAPEPPPPPPPKAVGASSAADRPSPAPYPFFLSLGPSVDVGSTPAPTIGVQVGGGVEWRGLRLEPMFAYYAPRSETVAARPSVGADFTLVSIGLRACIPASRQGLWLAGCAGGGAESLRGAGFGARIPHDGSAWSGAARVGVLGNWDISSIISMHAELEGVLPFTRPTFEVDGAGSVFQRKVLAARAALGFDVHF